MEEIIETTLYNALTDYLAVFPDGNLDLIKYYVSICTYKQIDKLTKLINNNSFLYIDIEYQAILLQYKNIINSVLIIERYKRISKTNVSIYAHVYIPKKI
jgi:hypothetical protein